LVTLQARQLKESKKRMKHARQAMAGLRNVIQNCKGVELLCRGHFKLIFSLLRHVRPRLYFASPLVYTVAARLSFSPYRLALPRFDFQCL
jgi:hypothetical protein